MSKHINFQDENHHYYDKKDWTDLEWIEEFNKFLQGNTPDGISIAKGHKPEMSHKKAWTIIWYLQEHMRILPDVIEKCYNCNELYNADYEGLYWESKGRCYCGNCESLVPENYDRGKK